MNISKTIEGKKYKLLITDLDLGYASLYAKVFTTAINKYSECFKPVAVILNNGAYLSPFGICEDLAEDTLSIMLAVESAGFYIQADKSEDFIMLECSTNQKGMITSSMFEKKESTYTVKAEKEVIIATSHPTKKFNIKILFARNSGYVSEFANRELVEKHASHMVSKCIMLSSVHNDILLTRFSIDDDGKNEKLELEVVCQNEDPASYINSVVDKLAENIKEFVKMI